MEALLIIDMQNDCFDLAARHDRAGTSARINQASRWFRARGKPVFFIRHDGTAEDYLIPGTPGWEIIAELEQGPEDLYVGKTVNDSFYGTELEALLQERGIGTLYVCGLATDFCVNATIHSALVKDYHLVVLADCHTTADRPGLSARQLIDFHNWLWPNLTPTKGRIEVKDLRAALEPVV